jgi:hypothetical protein
VQTSLCDSLDSKAFIYSLSESIIGDKSNSNIWNLSDVDTSNIMVIKDYFISRESKNKLILVSGSAGLSAGSASNLLILFACSDTPAVIWAGQESGFLQNDIRDLTGDGIKEIVCTTTAQWMGECDNIFEIFNFRNGNKNSVYKAHSISIIDCGGEESYEHSKGDTLEDLYNCSIIELKGQQFAIQQIHTVRIFNGGTKEHEILARSLISSDTATIRLQ